MNRERVTTTVHVAEVDTHLSACRNPVVGPPVLARRATGLARERDDELVARGSLRVQLGAAEAGDRIEGANDLEGAPQPAGIPFGVTLVNSMPVRTA